MNTSRTRVALTRSVIAAAAVMALVACGDKAPQEPAAGTTTPPATQQVTPASGAPAGNAVMFEANQTVAVTGPDFITWRDQMLTQGGADQVLEVTGRVFANEAAPGGEDLGTARAEAASILFMEKLTPERIVLKSEKSADPAPSGRFEAVSFRWVSAGTAVAAAPAAPASAGDVVAAAPAPAPTPAPAPAPEPAPAPAPAATPAPAPAAAPAAAADVRRATLYFGIGGTTPRLDAAARAQLKALVQTAQGGKINVVGHADNTGAATTNQALSEARAAAVRRLLVQAGARADDVQASGAGAEQPAQGNETADGRAANRRVEVSLP